MKGEHHLTSFDESPLASNWNDIQSIPKGGGDELWRLITVVIISGYSKLSGEFPRSVAYVLDSGTKSPPFTDPPIL
jgi:hypothetical protein